MGDSFLSFVAHVREAKGLAFDLAIAAVDDEMMFFAQIAHESRYVDCAVIFDAGKSDGAKIFFGEEFETSLTDPLVDKRIGESVTSKTRRQSFVENIFKLRLERKDVPDAGRGGSHKLVLLFFEFEKIEVIAAIFLFFGASKCFFGNAEKRKTRRKSERFLRAGERDIDAERVHRDWDGGEGRDGVEDKRYVGIFREGAANLRQRIHHASRGLVMNQSNGVESPTRQLVIDRSLIDMFTPFDLQRFRFLSATSGDIEPLIGERTAHAAEHALAHDIADGCFHHPPSR